MRRVAAPNQLQASHKDNCNAEVMPMCVPASDVC